MANFKNDTEVWCEINETFTINHVIQNNISLLKIVNCPQCIGEYNIRTDTLIRYENTSPIITLTDVSQTLTTVDIELSFNTEGIYKLVIGDPAVGTVIYTVHVTPVLTDLSMIFYEITDTEQLSRLQTGISYTLEANLLVEGTVENHFLDYLKNYRIAICNSEIDTTSQETILESLLENAEFSDQPEVNTLTRVTTDFVYDEDYPLFVLITHDYIEAYPSEFTVKFSDLKIYESTGNLVDMKCSHIIPLVNSISDENTTNITLDEFTSSNTFTCSRFKNPEDDLDDEDITYGNSDTSAVGGLIVKLDVVETGAVTLMATLTSDKSRIGQRSIILPDIEEGETATTIDIGESDDLWGFDIVDFENLEDWELTLQILNNTTDENSITFNNVHLEVYTIGIEPNQFDYYIEENNLGYYGVFMQDVDIPTGLNTEVQQLDIEGSDVNFISRQNVRDKTITLEFDIYDCDPVTSINILEKLAKLIYNERDIRTDQPIPKRFSTNLYPGKEWEYVCTKEMESEFDNGEIHAKVELLVPSGTYKTVDEITTGPIGYNQGLNKILPEITIGNLQGEEISILENHTNQKFIIRDITYATDDIITINCSDRTIVQSNPNTEDEVNLLSNCDMDNDWFAINTEYNFTSTNCNIMKITYFERG